MNPTGIGWLWSMTYPLRLYIRFSPWGRGKRFLTQRIIRHALPSHGSFRVPLPGGARVELRFDETLGLATLIEGLFEEAELKWLYARGGVGGVMVDVGANTGLYTCALAHAPGTREVWAFEPLPENLNRLREGIRSNEIRNAKVFDCALGQQDGIAQLLMAEDGAYCSLIEVREGKSTGRSMPVAVRALDEVWREQGSPRITTIKIDVEGLEHEVLKGAQEVLKVYRPLLLLEANSSENHERLVEFLGPLGYASSQPAGFKQWNYLFISERQHAR